MNYPSRTTFKIKAKHLLRSKVSPRVQTMVNDDIIREGASSLIA
jgi:hypothetical protein